MFPMTPYERSRMEELCAKIATEKNHRKFLELVQQLNSLLYESHNHLSETDPAEPSSKVP